MSGVQIFAEHPVAADMLLDILSDRGFSGAYIVNERIIPARIDPDTWQVVNEIDLIHKFRCVAKVFEGHKYISARSPMLLNQRSMVSMLSFAGHVLCESSPAVPSARMHHNCMLSFPRTDREQASRSAPDARQKALTATCTTPYAR